MHGRGTLSIILGALLLASCARKPAPESFAEARRGFKTTLLRKEAERSAAPEPPPGVLRLVKYPSPAGALAAYVSPDPGHGRRHPAIIWLFGGMSNSIDADAWTPGPSDNDQSATAFREAGLLMMYPSRRGGNDNPGFKEGFYGEVDDVVAAGDYLAHQPYVLPNRIYLGGHSTGGRLALLTAEATNRFRAVFAFGPVADVRGYGRDALPFDLSDGREVAMRAPILWLSSIRTPTYVFEGTGRGNIASVRAMATKNENPQIHFHAVEGGTHFTILQPLTRLIAARIVRDTGPLPEFLFQDSELSASLAHASE